MKKTFHFALFLMAIAIALQSCGGKTLGRLEKSDDYEDIYKGAIGFYEGGQYGKAKILFEKISPYYRGTLEAEKVQFYWAYCEFYQRLYQLSSYRFKNFYETYGRSAYVEEAEYMHAYSLYKDSPDYNLDQSSSQEAVVALQNFINRRPGSAYSVEAAKLIDEIQIKFETKAYENAKLYYRIGTAIEYRDRLEAALVTFDSFGKEFPDSKYNEEILWLSMETVFRLAENSIEDRRVERYTRAIGYYNDLKRRYPESEFLSQAQDIYQKSLAEVKETNTTN